MVCTFVWTHLSEGYSQGMCDLLSPLLVVLDNEPLAYACYLNLMESAIKLFPPNVEMNKRLANVQTLLQVGYLPPSHPSLPLLSPSLLLSPPLPPSLSFLSSSR